MTDKLERSIVEPRNPLLNASRLRNLPHSPGVRAGDYLFLSGRGGTDPDTGEAVRGSIANQVSASFRSIRHILESTGSSLERVVRVHMVFADPADMTEIEDVFHEFFPVDPPARTMISMQLRGDNACEIECMAVVGP